ncbi:uncharacterized protein [Watersipora subatra]|uniref:uncharacterized protein n=1 Tax=Watersipora subatra TaxID=2589382 RepID=UPI00355B746B
MVDMTVTQQMAEKLYYGEAKDTDEILTKIDGFNAEDAFAFINHPFRDGSNILSYLISLDDYKNATKVLHVLKKHQSTHVLQMQKVLFWSNTDSKTCFHILIEGLSKQNPHPSLQLGYGRSTDTDFRKVIEEFLNKFPDFRELSRQTKEESNKSNAMPTHTEAESVAPANTVGRNNEINRAKTDFEKVTEILFEAARMQLDHFVKTLLQKLDETDRIAQIKMTPKCEKCTANNPGWCEKFCGYNLLMVSLQRPNVPSKLALYIFDALEEVSSDDKLEVVIRKEIPEIYDKESNALRLAAKKNPSFAIRLLETCVPRDKWFLSLLEFGYSCSAMSSILLSDDIQHSELLSIENKAELSEALRNPAYRNLFFQLKMNLKVVDYFYTSGVIQNSFLIPMPSEGSKPYALIMHSKYSKKNVLKRSLEEAKAMEEALKSLNWTEVKVQQSRKVLTELKSHLEKIKDNCSIFLLCITSHGRAGHMIQENGRSQVSVQLSEIIDIISGILPKNVPKVLIFDMCRTTDPDSNTTYTTLQANNILLLSATLFGKTADEFLYIPALAEQIKCADGQTSLQEMHEVAAENVKATSSYEVSFLARDDSSSDEETAENEFQIPHMESTASRIILRRFDTESYRCVLDVGIKLAILKSKSTIKLVDRKLGKIHLMDSLSYKGQQTIEKRKLVSVDERFADYAVTDSEMAAMQQKDCVSCGLYVIKEDGRALAGIRLSIEAAKEESTRERGVNCFMTTEDDEATNWNGKELTENPVEFPAVSLDAQLMYYKIKYLKRY